MACSNILTAFFVFCRVPLPARPTDNPTTAALAGPQQTTKRLNQVKTPPRSEPGNSSASRSTYTPTASSGSGWGGEAGGAGGKGVDGGGTASDAGSTGRRSLSSLDRRSPSPLKFSSPEGSSSSSSPSSFGASSMASDDDSRGVRPPSFPSTGSAVVEGDLQQQVTTNAGRTAIVAPSTAVAAPAAAPGGATTSTVDSNDDTDDALSGDDGTGNTHLRRVGDAGDRVLAGPSAFGMSSALAEGSDGGDDVGANCARLFIADGKEETKRKESNEEKRSVEGTSGKVDDDSSRAGQGSGIAHVVQDGEGGLVESGNTDRASDGAVKHQKQQEAGGDEEKGEGSCDVGLGSAGMRTGDDSNDGLSSDGKEDTGEHADHLEEKEEKEETSRSAWPSLVLPNPFSSWRRTVDNRPASPSTATPGTSSGLSEAQEEQEQAEPVPEPASPSPADQASAPQQHLAETGARTGADSSAEAQVDRVADNSGREGIDTISNDGPLNRNAGVQYTPSAEPATVARSPTSGLRAGVVNDDGGLVAGAQPSAAAATADAASHEATAQLPAADAQVPNTGAGAGTGAEVAPAAPSAREESAIAAPAPAAATAATATRTEAAARAAEEDDEALFAEAMASAAGVPQWRFSPFRPALASAAAEAAAVEEARGADRAGGLGRLEGRGITDPSGRRLDDVGSWLEARMDAYAGMNEDCNADYGVCLSICTHVSVYCILSGESAGFVGPKESWGVFRG